MTGIILTQTSTFIIGPVAQLLGYIMEGIFFVIDKIGIPNIGLAIILFTIIINLLMLPLTIRQQKFSKLNAKMNPEIQEIQKKYKGKKDNNSMSAMQQETQAVYAKYGVSPSGSCVQMLIQMPILFALYRVIYAMPAYVSQIKDAFFPLVDNLIAQSGSTELVQNFKNSSMYSKQFTNELFISGDTEYVRNTFIDCLNKATTTEWNSIAEEFPALATNVSDTLSKLDIYNNFLGLNIANSPSYIVTEAFSSGQYLVLIGAIMIPLLSAVTQWINVKLMPQAPKTNQDDTANTMADSMKTMNTVMPLMSAVFCYTLPAGMGIYWVTGSVVRSIQQIVINKHIDKMDIDALVKKNEGKYKKKVEKNETRMTKLNDYAAMNTRNVETPATKKSNISQEDRDAAVKKASDYYKNGAKPGSIAAKANMVKQYNEKNNK